VSNDKLFEILDVNPEAVEPFFAPSIHIWWQ
jgi:hypothetical protein